MRLSRLESSPSYYLAPIVSLDPIVIVLCDLEDRSVLKTVREAEALIRTAEISGG